MHLLGGRLLRHARVHYGSRAPGVGGAQSAGGDLLDLPPVITALSKYLAVSRVLVRAPEIKNLYTGFIGFPGEANASRAL